MELGWASVNPFELIRERGVFLVLRAFGEDAGDGIYQWDGRTQIATIVLNSSKRPARLRFTAAHELGHHELHRGLAQTVVVEDEDVFARKTDEEREADAFAAYLLAPDRALQLAVGEKRDREIEPLDVARLMRKFGLSYEAILWRLFNARLVNDSQRRRLSEEAAGTVDHWMALAGFHEGDVFPPGEAMPAPYKAEVLALYRDRLISVERLANYLRCSVDQAAAEAREASMEPPAEEPYDEAAVEELLS
jgi:Zn-dependent peptidase ImmA (M78 family)